MEPFDAEPHAVYMAWLNLVSRELCHVERIVAALFLEQFLVTANLNNPSSVHNNDFIRISDGGETVGNNQTGAVFHQIDHGILNVLLCACIHRGGCFIQNQNLGICQNCTGDCKELSLTLRQSCPCLFEECLVLLGEPLNEVAGIAHLGGVNHLLIRRVRIGVLDIVLDGVGE